MDKAEKYQKLVESFYQAIIHPQEDAYLLEAMKLASSLDKSTVKQAKAEASVMAIDDSKFEA